MNYLDLKDWQARAFVASLLYCCQQRKCMVHMCWDFLRISTVNEIYPGIFRFGFIDSLQKLGAKDNSATFINNLRLAPPESHAEILKTCRTLLNLNRNDCDDETLRILERELTPMGTPNIFQHQIAIQ